MGTSLLYEDEEEKKRHANVIRNLAHETGRSETELCQLYEHFLEEFKGKAYINAYLSIFVSRRVKAWLMNNATALTASAHAFEQCKFGQVSPPPLRIQ